MGDDTQFFEDAARLEPARRPEGRYTGAMAKRPFRRWFGRQLSLIGIAIPAIGCDDARPPGLDAAVRDAASSDGDESAEAAPPCEPAPEERRACRPPLDTSLCPATREELAPPPCGLRVYVGPIDDNSVYYVSYADIPPIGGPSIMCVYDSTSGALTGAWNIGDYPHWCCQSSLDVYEGVVTDALISAAVSMATHPPCDDAVDGGDDDADGGHDGGHDGSDDGG
jgi:hypothetical protein